MFVTEPKTLFNQKFFIVNREPSYYYGRDLNLIIEWVVRDYYYI